MVGSTSITINRAADFKQNHTPVKKKKGLRSTPFTMPGFWGFHRCLCVCVCVVVRAAMNMANNTVTTVWSLTCKDPTKDGPMEEIPH